MIWFTHPTKKTPCLVIHIHTNRRQREPRYTSHFCKDHESDGDCVYCPTTQLVFIKPFTDITNDTLSSIWDKIHAAAPVPNETSDQNQEKRSQVHRKDHLWQDQTQPAFWGPHKITINSQQGWKRKHSTEGIFTESVIIPCHVQNHLHSYLPSGKPTIAETLAPTGGAHDLPPYPISWAQPDRIHTRLGLSWEKLRVNSSKLRKGFQTISPRSRIHNYIILIHLVIFSSYLLTLLWPWPCNTGKRLHTHQTANHDTPCTLQLLVMEMCEITA